MDGRSRGLVSGARQHSQGKAVSIIQRQGCDRRAHWERQTEMRDADPEKDEPTAAHSEAQA